MSDDPRQQPHPLYPEWTVAEWEARQAGALAEAAERGELASAADVAEWEANEKFRDGDILRTALQMLADGASGAQVREKVREAMERPNEWWGERREGRIPRDDM